MSLRSLLVIGLALVSGISAALGVRFFIDNPLTGPDPETVPVVVAAADVPRGMTLSDDLLKTRACPKDLVPVGAITRAEEVIGRVAFTPLVKDEPVLEGKLATKGSGRGMAALTQKGMRTFTIPTPTVAAGVAGFILPGDKVDVLLTVKGQNQNDGSGGGITTRLLQNVEVLAVNQRLSAPSENKVDPKELQSVTLLVSPNQDGMLALAQTMGTLHLSLRNGGDGRDANTPPVTLADLRLLQGKPKDQPKEAKPARTRAQPIRIRILRGTHESAVTIRPEEKPNNGR
jgi:pilus assembly protein CpaB